MSSASWIAWNGVYEYTTDHAMADTGGWVTNEGLKACEDTCRLSILR